MYQQRKETEKETMYTKVHSKNICIMYIEIKIICTKLFCKRLTKVIWIRENAFVEGQSFIMLS